MLKKASTRRPRRSSAFAALQSGEVDIVAATPRWTLTARHLRSASTFAGVNLLRRPGLHGADQELGVKSAKDLNGATVCVQPGTTTELNLAGLLSAPTR